MASPSTVVRPPSPTGYLTPSPFSFFNQPYPSSSSSTTTSTSTKTTTTNPKSHHHRRTSSTSSTSSSLSSSSTSSSSTSTTSSYDSILEDQLQWEESIHQLKQILDLVALPYFAKWAGRKWAYWMFGRYLENGFSRSFFVGSKLDLLAKSFGS